MDGDGTAADGAEGGAEGGAESGAAGGGSVVGEPSEEEVAREAAMHAADVRATQDALHRLRILPLLVSLSCDAATATDPALRLQAVHALCALVGTHTAGADEMLASRVRPAA